MKLFRNALLSLLLALAGLGATAQAATGVYPLAARQITAALSAEAQTAITNLGGMMAATIEATLAYGSGGTTAVVVVQTSVDGGTLWRDVAYFSFTTASATKYANVSGLTAKNVAAYAVLAADGVNDSLLGDRLRAVITTTGTYVNTTLTVRASVR